MKNTLFLLMLLLISFQCKKKEDTTVAYLGVWQKVSETKSECKNKVSNGTKPFDCKSSATNCIQITIKADKSYSIIKNKLSFESGTWSSNGQNISFCTQPDSIDICITKIIKLENKSLTFESKNEGTGCKLVEIYQLVDEKQEKTGKSE